VNQAQADVEAVGKALACAPFDAQSREAFRRYLESRGHGARLDWEEGPDGGLVMHVYWPRSIIESTRYRNRGER